VKSSGDPSESGRLTTFHAQYARIPIAHGYRRTSSAWPNVSTRKSARRTLERLNIDWARYGELDAAGKLGHLHRQTQWRDRGLRRIHRADPHPLPGTTGRRQQRRLCRARGTRWSRCAKLLRFAEMVLKAQGVQKIYYHVKQTRRTSVACSDTWATRTSSACTPR
jgi:hypothetical protein